MSDASPCRIGPSGHGFVLIDGELTQFDVPGSIGTAGQAINARRDVVGGYFDAAGVLHAYLTRVRPE